MCIFNAQVYFNNIIVNDFNNATGKTSPKHRSNTAKTTRGNKHTLLYSTDQN